MREWSSAKPVEILLVEDNPGEARLAVEAFKECQAPHHINVASDGDQVLASLRRAGTYAVTRRPDLILLDLNLPCKDGHEILAEIKADPDLRRIPVLVLTSSSAKSDIDKSYDLHANGYLVKPVAIDEFVELVKLIERFWFMHVELSNRGG